MRQLTAPLIYANVMATVARSSRLAAAPIAAVVFALAVPAAQATTIDVTTTEDSVVDNGNCSLREATIAANSHSVRDNCAAGAGNDVIVLPAGRITLASPSGDLNVTAPGTTISGQGMGTTTIDAAQIDRVISSSGPLKLSGLTITGGSSAAGGGIFAGGGLDLDHVAVVANHATGIGGGVLAVGTTTIADSVIADNSAGDASGSPADHTGGNAGPGGTGGGGLGDTASDGSSGGGIRVQLRDNQTLTVTRSTFSGNRAGNGGDAGDGTGGAGGAGSPTLAAGSGGSGVGGTGGRGGSGGAIMVDATNGVQSGSATIQDSIFRDNVAGNGGDGGAATGGPGGTGPNGPGSGGTATGGNGGAGGSGGAINGSLSPVTLKSVTLIGNRAGKGGTGGMAQGGNAGIAISGGGPGGIGFGGAGGTPGDGGGIYMRNGGVSLTQTTIDGNHGGDGGNGGAATGGQSSPGGGAVGAIGGAGAPGPRGGGVAFASTYISRLDYTDLTSNLLGAVGQGGAATSPGAAGAAGVGGGIWTKGDVTIFTSIVRGNTSAECAREGNPTITSGSSLQTIGPDDATCPGRALDPGLGPLLDNGGPVPTRAPSATGPAVGIVTQCGTGVKDARGVTGPAPCEPGAYQIVPPAATTGDASDATVSATVNTNGPAGTAHFDYGTSDAYGSSTADQAVDPGLADRAVSAALSGLPVGATIHYRVVVTTHDGTSAGADRTFATPAPPPQQQPAGGGTPPPPKDTVAPSLRSLKLSAKKFKAGKKVTISFASSEPGGYKLAFEQVLAGKKVKKKGKTTCVKAHGKVPKKSRCSYYKSYGSMAGNAKAGSNAVAFAGKVGKMKLAAGSYRLTLVETDAAGNKSEAVSAKFAIVK